MKTLCLFLGLSLAILTFLNQETKALSFDSNGILFRDSRETKTIRNSAIKRNTKIMRREPKTKSMISKCISFFFDTLFIISFSVIGMKKTVGKNQKKIKTKR